MSRVAGAPTSDPQPTRSRFSRIAVVVCDSVGCGDAPDAEEFGDLGANTLAHVIAAAEPKLPNLAGLGLGRIPGIPGLGGDDPTASWGRMVERAPAKDTMLGHWELMGLVADAPFPTYPGGFPPEILDAFRERTGLEPLGNEVASGTEIIRRLGEEHVRTGRPILYTSGDSVFQLAAHEEVIGPEALYRMCRRARALLMGEHGVGRVIARPFVGAGPGEYARVAAHRKDFPLPPPGPTVLDRLQEAGRAVFGIGKIHDIFAGRGLDGHHKTADNREGIEATIRALRDAAGDLILTNLVDFDSEYGHRNDPAGYAAALEELDRELPRLLQALPAEGCLMLTADHGNDPTAPGTDHTRECVPLLVTGPGVAAVDLGTRESFADLGMTVLEGLGVPPPGPGRSFLDRL